MVIKKDNLLKRDDIKEELKLVKGSVGDFISPNGNLYSYYKEYDGYYKKKTFINNHNGYIYCTINYINKGSTQRRLHILVAEAYVENPNPEKYLIVGHKDNNKTNDVYTNLYWTTNQENILKAIDDGLLINKKGIDSKDSKCIKVIDLKNNLIAVYGSMRECTRMIDNLELGYISKIIIRNGNYKPRNKKYKYIEISREEYEKTDNKYKNLKLEEHKKMSKEPSIFKAINLSTGDEMVSDNQKQFAKDHNLNQSQISNAIKNKCIYNNWKFELINKINYTEASCYDNLINLTNDVIIQNIKTNKSITFKTFKELKDYFGLTGNDIKQYYKNNQLIFSEWKIISC